MRYKVTIQETLSKTIEVQACSIEEAEIIIRSMYRNGEIILGSDDYVCTQIVVKDS